LWLNTGVLLRLPHAAPRKRQYALLILFVCLSCCGCFCVMPAAQVGAMMMENLVDIDWADVRVSGQ
jgi:hypothetical protein